MLWLKAFHIIFVVCWFAGLFYLPRIFVYYAASDKPAVREQLAVMARKLYRFVTPFMVIAIALGVVMIAMNQDYYMRTLCAGNKRPSQPA
jgi:putative membrane protein